MRRRQTLHEQRIQFIADLLTECDYRLWCVMRHPSADVHRAADDLLARLRSDSVRDTLRLIGTTPKKRPARRSKK